MTTSGLLAWDRSFWTTISFNGSTLARSPPSGVHPFSGGLLGTPAGVVGILYTMFRLSSRAKLMARNKATGASASGICVRTRNDLQPLGTIGDRADQDRHIGR